MVHKVLGAIANVLVGLLDELKTQQTSQPQPINRPLTTIKLGLVNKKPGFKSDSEENMVNTMKGKDEKGADVHALEKQTSMKLSAGSEAAGVVLGREVLDFGIDQNTTTITWADVEQSTITVNFGYPRPRPGNGKSSRTDNLQKDEITRGTVASATGIHKETVGGQVRIFNGAQVGDRIFEVYKAQIC